MARLVRSVGVCMLVSATLVGCTSDDPGNRESDPETVHVPQLLMMTLEQATERLDEVGLRVKVRYGALNECDLPDGRVISSDPAPSSTLDPGAKVVVHLAGRPGGGTAYCVGPEQFEETAIPLLDLARFGEGGPRFAAEVQIWIDGHRTRTLTAQQPGDPEAWGDPSPLTDLVAATEEYRTERGRVQSPSIWSMGDEGSQFACGPDDPPQALADRESVVVTVDHSYEGPHPTCHWFRVYQDQQGRVDAVTSSTKSPRE